MAPADLDTQTLKGLLAEVKQQPSYSTYLKASRIIEQLSVSEDGTASLRRIRVAVLSSSTIDPLVAAIQVDGYALGLLPSFHIAAYGRMFEEALNPSSGLYAFQPQVVLVILDLEALIPKDDGVLTPHQAEAALERVHQVLQALKQQTSSLIVLSNFIAHDLFPFALVPDPMAVAYQQLNTTLRAAYGQDPQVLLLDLDGLAAYHGRARSIDPSLRYLGGMNMSESFLQLVSRKFLAILNALVGRARKCLVLDLDNTLWGGILGEVGPDGIHLGQDALGKPYVDFQRTILRLRERGVLLAINSKNNPDEVLPILREHPHMILREHQFAGMQIDWSPKPEKMERLATELNLGLDSLVFMDDDPAERLQMRLTLPEVLCVEMPSNPALFSPTLLELPVFETVAMTEEDWNRASFYAVERQREALRQRAQSLEEFLTSLQLAVTIRLNHEEDIARAAQLTQKTNQFNLTTRRYASSEIAGMMRDPTYRLYTLRLRDIFGDSGLTALAIVNVEAEEWHIDTFLMSCRIIGRGIETVLLNEVIADATRSGAKRLWGEYRPTPKNGLVKDFYAKAGFMTTDGGHQWCRELEPELPSQPPWVTIERESQPAVVAG